MKRMLLVLVLGMPGAVWATPPVQQQAPMPATTSNRHPRLLDVKFVLRPVPKQDGDLPRIRFDSQAAVIAPVRWDRQGYRRFGLPGPGPNVELCESWGCETFVQR